jgi:hypothetical protein
MAILFRCPCGRSMVANSAKVGSIITCPNCHRSLRVPSGKDRGKELGQAPRATPATRPCPRCGQSAPVDARVCSHCRASLVEGTRPKAAATSPAERMKGGTPILYGGSRATWWSRLSSNAKAGILSSIGGFVIVTIVVAYLFYSSWQAGQVSHACGQLGKALNEGQKLESQGKFQDAYEFYFRALAKADFVRDGGSPSDLERLSRIQDRAGGLQYIVEEPKTREPLRWQPKSQAELYAAQQELLATYPSYRQRVLAVADAALAAIENTRSEGNQTAFAQKVGLAMDAFIRLTNSTKPHQRRTYSFDNLVEGIRELTAANRRWDNTAVRENLLNHAKQRFEALKEFVRQPPGTPMGDKHKSL